MKVKELIAKLQEFDGELEVETAGDSDIVIPFLIIMPSKLDYGNVLAEIRFE